MIHLEWHIDGEKQLSRNLRVLAHDVSNFEPAFKSASRALKKVFSQEVFDTEGAAIGESWSPLSRAYAARKEKKYAGKGILEATGEMKRAFKTIHGNDFAAIWNTAEYFKYHQSNQPRTKIPRRVMMKLDDNLKQDTVRIFQNYIRKALSKK